MKWAFWFQWLIASILGFVFGLGVSCGVTAFFPVYYGDSNPIYRAISMLRLALGATSIGCSIGVFQWSVLRSYVSKWWVFATAVGWAIGGLAISTISDTMNYVPSAENWRVVLVGVIWGGAIGVAQSLSIATTSWRINAVVVFDERHVLFYRCGNHIVCCWRLGRRLEKMGADRRKSGFVQWLIYRQLCLYHINCCYHRSRAGMAVTGTENFDNGMKRINGGQRIHPLVSVCLLSNPLSSVSVCALVRGRHYLVGR